MQVNLRYLSDRSPLTSASIIAAIDDGIDVEFDPDSGSCVLSKDGLSLEIIV